MFSAEKRLLAVSPFSFATIDECRRAIEHMQRAMGAGDDIQVDPRADA